MNAHECGIVRERQMPVSKNPGQDKDSYKVLLFASSEDPVGYRTTEEHLFNKSIRTYFARTT